MPNVPSLPAEWLAQAERDLEVASKLRDEQFFEWACYAAQQSAEKAVKAVRIALGTNVDTIKKHEMGELLAEIPHLHPKPNAKLVRAAELDIHLQAARYPGMRGKGPMAPFKTYNDADAADSIEIAEAVLAFVQPLLQQVDAFWQSL